jgi:hypothetical protein
MPDSQSSKRTPTQEILFMLGQLFATTKSVEEKMTEHLISSNTERIAQGNRWEEFIKWQAGVDNRLELNENCIDDHRGRLDNIENVDVRLIIKEELAKVEISKKNGDDKQNGGGNTITFKWIVEKVLLAITIPVILYLLVSVLPAVIKNLPD